jgi:16S rRNA (uracil1498-N3)-methyltransferase
MSESAPARPPRVLVPDLAAQRGKSEENEILLRKEEREHVRSRRLRDGSEVVVLDGKGLRARGALARKGTAVALFPFEESPSFSSLSSTLHGEPANRVTVALACAEPSRVEWAIEKGTECGAAGFVLLDAERSQRAHVAALAKRIPRLVRIAEEATKQCDRTIVPLVEGPKSTEDFLRKGRGERPSLFFVADPSGVPIEDGPVPPRRTRLLSERSEFKREGEGVPAGRDRQSLLGGEAAVVAIGPEGGFSPSEISLFAEKSPVFLSLGPRILRLETAVVVALARLVDPG